MHFLKPCDIMYKPCERRVSDRVANEPLSITIVSDFVVEGTPVPIPNTVVKLNYDDNTWREAAREDSSLLTPIFLLSSVGRAHDC